MSTNIKESNLALNGDGSLTELFSDFRNAKGTGSFTLPVAYQGYSDYVFSVYTTVNTSSVPTAYKVLFVNNLGNVIEQTFAVKSGASGFQLTPATPKVLLKNAYLIDSSGQPGLAATPAFYQLEKTLDLDIDGDGFVGASVLLIDKPNKSLSVRDVTEHEEGGFYELLSLDVKGKSSSLTIDTDSALGEDSRLVIGSRHTNWEDGGTTQDIDALLSNFKLLGSGMSAGFGTSSTGKINIQNSNIDLAGSLLSSYVLELLQLEDQSIAEDTLGVTLVGFGPRSSGEITISNSVINYVRPDDETVFYGASVDEIDLSNSYGSLKTLFIAGSTGGTGKVTINNATQINMLGLNNAFTIGETGGVASATINNSVLNMDASYSTSDRSFALADEKDLGSNSLQIGNGDGTKSTKVSSLKVENFSEIYLTGTQSNVNIGWEWGLGSATITNSSVFQKSERDAEAINNGKIDPDTYQYSWSGSYLNIGGEWGDGNNATNETSNGYLKLSNSYYSMYGPHAGISVGVSSSKAIGQLELSSSVVSVLAGGAIYSSNGGSDYGWMESSWNESPGPTNFLSGGVNSNGDWNTNYYAFINIGGRSWSDAGGNGEVNLVNSRLQIFQMDYDSFDVGGLDSGVAYKIDSTYVNAGSANFSLGQGGSRAIFTMDTSSTLDVGGGIHIANNQSSTGNAGKFILSNDGGVINANSYHSGHYENASVKNASITYINDGAEINIERANFYNNSKLIGDGTIRTMHMFSGDIDIYSSDKVDPDIFTDINEEYANLHIAFSNSEILIGDSLAITKKAPALNTPISGISTEKITAGKGTLNFAVDESNPDALDSDSFTELQFTNTTFKFELGSSAATRDLISIGNFDNIDFTNCKFDVKVDKGFVGSLDGIQLVRFEDTSYRDAGWAQDFSLNQITLSLIGSKTRASLEMTDSGIFLNI